eukprot:2879164-Pyramimonas_sp.AAC.1
MPREAGPPSCPARGPVPCRPPPPTRELFPQMSEHVLLHLADARETTLHVGGVQQFLGRRAAVGGVENGLVRRLVLFDEAVHSLGIEQATKGATLVQHVPEGPDVALL